VSFTVVPLHNLDLPAGTRIPFGGKFVLQDVPEWLKTDTGFLNDIGRHDKTATLTAKHALVSDYEAASIGEPDPEWKGPQPKGIQDLRFQSAMLANMAMWLIQPSTVCFTVGFHALTTLEGGRTVRPPIILRSEREGPLYCHPRDQHNPVEPKHVIRAAALYEKLSTVPRKNAVWAALRAFWAALVSYTADYRYPLFWQGLESLFGAEDDSPGISRRLRERISFLLASDAAMQKKLYDIVKLCYKTRSEIVHGRWEEGPEIDDRMGETEGIVRTVVRHIMDRPGMLGAFLSPRRDDFLEAWVQSRAFTPPPFPK
jgi:hypothetical protein